MTETDTATLDRIVDGETAVLLLESDETVAQLEGEGETVDRHEAGNEAGDQLEDSDETGDQLEDSDETGDQLEDSDETGDQLEDSDERIDQLEVAVTQLPPEGRHEGAVLEVVVEAGALCEATYLPEVTRSRREAAQERLDRLSRELSDRD